MFKKNLYNVEMKTGLKKLFVSTLLLLIFSMLACLVAKAQSKNIYITLDVSGSMYGFKYDLANYSVQVISVLNHKNNVRFVVCGAIVDFGDKYKYTSIHHDASNICKNFKSLYSTTEIGDIKTFNNHYDGKPQNQEIFIIGDGYWADDKEIKTEFLKNVS